MKKLLVLSVVAILGVSCSSFDKYKTPETSDGGVAEGEKSSYLLNKTEDTKAPAPTTTETKSAKKKKKKAATTKN